MRPLSEAEFKLMAHLASGKSRQEVAQSLGISKGTLMDRITAIRIKLNADSFDRALEAFRKVYADL